MNMPLCSRCKKNVAVIYITRLEDGKAHNEGLCLKCAKELNIKPVTDMIERFGITDSDIENVSKELENTNPEELMQGLFSSFQMPTGTEDKGEEEPEEENSSQVPVIPFFSMRSRESDARQEDEADKPEKPRGKKREKKKKFLIQ